MIGSVASVVLRQVPQALIKGIAAGEYRVAGSVIQSVASGRIVGHLQETSALSAMALPTPLDVPGIALQAALDGVALIQNEQIKAAIELVRSLQLANLTLSGAAIGVSIAGTALLAHRIGSLEAKIDTLLPALETVAKQVEILRAEKLADDFTRLRTLAAQVKEAWLPSATSAEWIAIAREAHFAADAFDRRARETRALGDGLLVEPFVDAFALASDLRITARLAAGQDDMARHAASDRANNLVELGRDMQVAKLSLAASCTDDLGSLAWEGELDRSVEHTTKLVMAARARETSAAASVETLLELEAQGLSGREWLEASHSETASPVLFLESSRR